jgi:hypothetical protein
MSELRYCRVCSRPFMTRKGMHVCAYCRSVQYQRRKRAQRESAKAAA